MAKSKTSLLLKIVLPVLLILCLLPFIVTSSWFIGAVVIPQAESATGMEIEADCDLSLINSSLSISNVIVKDPQGVSLSVDSLKCEYGLSKLIAGTIAVSKLEVENVNLVMDGAVQDKSEVVSPSGEGTKTEPKEVKSSKATESKPFVLPEQQ